MSRHVLQVIASLLWLTAYSSAQDSASAPAKFMVLTNEQYISGLRSKLDLADPKVVFEAVFFSLDSVVVVYPTENYYYFECVVNGRHLKGNIGLFATDIDSGIINFAYEDKGAFHKIGGVAIEMAVKLSNADGVGIRRLDDFQFLISFHGKYVLFKCYDPGLTRPLKSHLAPNEEYVCTTLDESGIKFALLFDKVHKHLFWILDQDDDVPEIFIPYTESLFIGARTEFVFLVDTMLNRKVLIGVKKENIEENNWFDGPFDQLPDNYIRNGQLNLRGYLEACFPKLKGNIDQFGNYLDERGSRVAISSYLFYKTRKDILKVYFGCRNSYKKYEDFIYNITKQRVLK